MILSTYSISRNLIVIIACRIIFAGYDELLFNKIDEDTITASSIFPFLGKMVDSSAGLQLEYRMKVSSINILLSTV